MTQSTPNQHSILLCTAVRGGISPTYEASVDRLAAWCREHNIQLDKRRVAEAPIDAARDVLAALYLAAKDANGAPFTHCLMVDAGVGFAPETVQHLIEAEEDFTAVAVPLRTSNVDKRFTNNFAVDVTRETRETNKASLKKKGSAVFMEINAIGAAMICIRHSVLLRMYDAYPEIRSGNEPTSYFLPGLFDTDGLTHVARMRASLEKLRTASSPEQRADLIDQTLNIDPTQFERCGEDIAFCRRWRALDTPEHPAKIWLLVDATVRHEGHAYFEGNFAEAQLGGLK